MEIHQHRQGPGRSSACAPGTARAGRGRTPSGRWSRPSPGRRRRSAWPARRWCRDAAGTAFPGGSGEISRRCLVGFLRRPHLGIPSAAIAHGAILKVLAALSDRPSKVAPGNGSRPGPGLSCRNPYMLHCTMTIPVPAAPVPRRAAVPARFGGGDRRRHGIRPAGHRQSAGRRLQGPDPAGGRRARLDCRHPGAWRHRRPADRPRPGDHHRTAGAGRARAESTRRAQMLRGGGHRPGPRACRCRPRERRARARRPAPSASRCRPSG